MSSFEEPFGKQSAAAAEFSQSEIDRMVDGELSEEQQRSLLQRLENSPTGWRELALAYVEASAWKSHFSAPETRAGSNIAGLLATNPGPRPPESSTAAAVSPEATQPCKPNSGTQSFSSTVFAAIAVLLVFGLGVWLGWTQVEKPMQPSYIADSIEHAQDNVDNSPAQDEPQQPVSSVAHNADRSIPESVQVVYSDGQSDVLRVVDVPLAASIMLESPQQFDEFWDQRRSAIPAELRAELERSGHQISESREFWPAQLPDGRSVVIPVSQVRVANNPLAIP